ncbi:glycosyltransferase family 1 protein [Radiobacillus deserti]|uniref:Glycosyltransferase family 1 protein n=1 Tax=Radiobacillus deserti TaxID=2594883 RepID=A0A516KJ96_9BACI|nr:glycosyltransferase family 1 protein [Radiobacillus deserti]QDP41459.1 glycosyltransferase family 1 protein [Radiobacillus deserti]
MIRVLHIVSTLSKSSGVMSFIMSYFRNINRGKIQFDFLYWQNDNNSFIDEIKELGGNVYLIPKPNISKKFWYDFTAIFKENSGKYNIIHLHEVYLNMLIYPFLRKYNINHLIAHAHTTKYSDKKISSLRNRILCLPLKNTVSEYFACSKAAGEFYFGKTSKRDNEVKIINNAIDCDKFTFDKNTRMEMRNELDINKKFVVGHIGRFNAQKNHDFLIDIFFEIQKQKTNSLLVLVGIGPLEGKIREKVERLGIPEKVLFLGQRNDVSDILQAIDVFVLPSFFEGLGIVLVEAQAAGLDCFTSDIVPVEAKVTDRLKFLSLNLSAKEWAEKIIEETKSAKRVDEIEKIRDAGFDIRIEAEKLEKAYISLS